MGNRRAVWFTNRKQSIMTTTHAFRLAKDEAADRLTIRDLEGAPGVLARPNDRPDGRARSYHGGRHRYRFDPQLVEALREVGRQTNTSLFITFAAALNALLYRYTSNEEILLGIPLSERGPQGLDSVTDSLRQAHLLRTRIPESMTFRELQTSVQKAILEFNSQRAVPLGLPEYNQSYSPLFQVMIEWAGLRQQQSSGELDAPLRNPPLAEPKTATFDLMFSLTDGAEGVVLELGYNTDLFDRAKIDRTAGHFRRMLEGISANPDQRLSELPLLTSEERAQLLEEWNDTHLQYPQSLLLHQLLERQAEKSPNAVAVVSDEASLTYGELNRRANQLARYLQRLGVGPDQLVGVCMRRSLEMVVALYGILKAGGAYVPLDPAYPEERLSFMVADSRMLLLLTETELINKISGHSAQVVCLDRDRRSIGTECGDNADTACTPESLAYVIYTSGSTGKPKGVMIEHRNTTALTAWAGTVFSNEELGGVLFSTSICFDLSVFELFVTLGCGGKVILAENALALSRLKASDEVTLINTVPSVMAELLRIGPLPSSVRVVNLAGEPLTNSLVNRLYDQGSVKKVYDLYGPTETTTYSTYTLRFRGGRMTIGRPITNTTIYLLDKNMNPVPVGVPGQLHIGGSGVARGYFRREELTGQKFVRDPFDPRGTARIYRTGDLARYLPDGNIEYLGRQDHQVKIRGFRIELGEIESILAEHPSVQEAVVVVRAEVSGDKRLLAYLTAKPGKAPRPADVRRLLRSRLPEHMVPSAFVTLEQLPLTPNGKVDRTALALRDLVSAESGKEFVAPRTPAEYVLAGIWQDLLRVEQIGIRDDFFELGGNSLLAVRLQALVERRLGRRVPVASIFQAPTVDEYAELLIAGTDSDRPTHLVFAAPPPQAKTPLFCLQFPSSGRLLAKHLGSERAVYGIVCPFDRELAVWHGQHRLETTIEALALRCLPMIRAAQPHGPYCLSGFCFGGVLAFEVASRLVSEGEEVTLLAMIDATYRPGCKPLPLRWLRRWFYHAHETLLHGPAYIVRKLQRSLGVRKVRRSRLQRLNRAVATGPIESDDLGLPKAAFMEHLLRAYRGTPYSGRTLLVRSSAGPKGFDFDPGKTDGWGDLLTGEFSVEDLSCDHLQIGEEPHVGDVANKLTACLDQAEREESSARGRGRSSMRKQDMAIAQAAC